MPVDNRAVVEGFYDRYLGRTGQEEGIAYHTANLAGGRSVADVESEFQAAEGSREEIRKAQDLGFYQGRDLGGTMTATQRAALGLPATPEAVAPPATPEAVAPPAPAPAPAAPPPPAAVTTDRVADSSTAAQLQGLLTRGSPYIERAKGETIKAGHARGLQNTSMLAQAGEQAAISAALPIASQDAAQIAAQNLSFQQYGQQSNLLGQELQGRASESALLRAHETGLQLEERDFLGTQAELDRATQVGIAESDIVARQALLDADLDAQQLRDLMNVDASDRGAVVTGMANANNAYTNAFNAIMANPDLDAGTRGGYLEHIGVQRDDALRILEDVYNIDLDWTIATPAATT